MIRLDQIALDLGDRPIFRNLGATVHAGQKVGIVGRNGVGKSTLFQMILGRMAPDDGDVTLPSQWRISHMSQQPDPSTRGALDYVLDGDKRLRQTERDVAQATETGNAAAIAAAHERLSDADGYTAEARAARILNGLGFHSDEFDKPQQAFSGGWRIRLELARTLLAPADLMLLDEPTNHLDLETTLYLERWLMRFPGTLLIIAHDRAFLDNVVEYVLHMRAQTATLYRGNYSAFERQYADALERERRQAAEQQKKVSDIEAFIRRFRAKASKAKQVQSRIKSLERMQQVVVTQLDSGYRFGFAGPKRMPTPLLSLNDVTLGYDGTPVLSHISETILPGDRIGVLGTNGAGKSTLLKAIVDRLPADRGEIIRNGDVTTGYFAQHQLELLDAERTPMQTIAAASTMTPQQCRTFLGTWGFSDQLADQRVETLSGGERARLVLALLALTQPAMLVLDEPTNHLDLDAREALTLALQQYPGALLLVSHDRELLNRCADTLWLVANGTVAVYEESLDDYVAAQQGAERAHDQPKIASDRKQQRRDAAARRAEQKPLRERVAHLERTIDALERDLKSSEGELADPDLYNEMAPDALQQALQHAGTLRKQLESAIEEWTEATEALDKLSGTSSDAE